MNKRLERITTSELFRKRFLSGLSSDFVWQNGAIQSYSLGDLSNYFLLPTPLLQTDYHFFIIINEGSFTLQIGEETLPVKGPALIFVAAGTIVSFSSIEQEMKGYFVLFEEEVLPAVLTQTSQLNLFTASPVISMDEQQLNWILQLCGLLYAEVNQPKFDIQTAQALLKALLHKTITASGSGASLSRSQEIAIAFKRLVHQHFVQHKNVLFYAQRLSITENYLNKCTKTIYHKSAKELILQITILHAQLLMWDSTKTVSEISFSLNFEDPSYFSRLFKKITKMNPTTYRSQINPDLS